MFEKWGWWGVRGCARGEIALTPHTKKKKTAPLRDRTASPQIRSLMLYPIELVVQIQQVSEERRSDTKRYKAIHHIIHKQAKTIR